MKLVKLLNEIMNEAGSKSDDHSSQGPASFINRNDISRQVVYWTTLCRLGIDEVDVVINLNDLEKLYFAITSNNYKDFDRLCSTFKIDKWSQDALLYVTKNKSDFLDVLLKTNHFRCATDTKNDASTAFSLINAKDASLNAWTIIL